MLYIYDKEHKSFSPVEETDFKSHEILERRDMEKWIIQYPKILGEDLLFITSEYDKFDKTKERLDLLFLDKSGKLVVVELKRDDSGKHAELQALKYAAYCSTMTLREIVLLRKKFLTKNHVNKTEEEIEKEIRDFVDNEDFEEIDDKPRVILVAGNFKPEVTATVLWLRKFGVDISCVKITLYQIDRNKLGLVSSTIIPVPEAEEFIVKTERKLSSDTLTRTQKEYINFYQELINLVKDKIHADFPEPKPRSYYKIPTEISGVHFEWGFHGRPRRNSLGVELHFEKSSKEANIRMLEEICKHIKELEEKTNEKVICEKEWQNSGWARIYIERKGYEITEDLKKWAAEKMVIFYKVLHPILIRKFK